MNEHEDVFIEWWYQESGWSDGPQSPLLAEGHLARRAWNAALTRALAFIYTDANAKVNIQELISED